MEAIAALQSAASPTLDGLMLLITNLGSEQVYVALLVVAFGGLDAGKGRRLAVYFLAAAFLMELLKLVFDSPRPFELDPGLLRSSAAAETATGTSFPSGHALLAATFWGLAASYVRRGWFYALAGALVVPVALSRGYLGVHFPVDVLAGAAFGLAFALGGRALDGVRWRLARGWVVGLGLALPFALHLALPTENSGLFMGALAAFLVFPELVPHRTDGPALGRAVLTVIGLALVFGALLGSSALVPDALRHSPVGSFVRYLLVAAVGALLVPLLGRWLRLVPTSGRPAPAAPGAALPE